MKEILWYIPLHGSKYIQIDWLIFTRLPYNILAAEISAIIFLNILLMSTNLIK